MKQLSTYETEAVNGGIYQHLIGYAIGKGIDMAIDAAYQYAERNHGMITQHELLPSQGFGTI